MKKVFNLFIVCFLALFCIAQNENPGIEVNRTNIWRFGWGSNVGTNDAPGLDFTTGSPVVINGGPDVNQGATTICDSAGSLQLYGGYLSMFNRQYQPMINAPIVGDSGWSGINPTNIAIPQPGHPNKIYYFSAAASLKYTLVDMSLGGGLGAAIERNVELEPYPFGVKVAAVHHCNGRDIWVAWHKWQTDSFFVYLLSDTGLSTVPVISHIGPMDAEYGYFQGGRMKFSPDGNKLAIVFHGVSTPAYLFDFDKISGVVSNPVALQKDTGDQGISFSPDNTKLYISTNNGRIVQYNLSLGDPQSITASKKIIVDEPTDYITIQLARDGKIYLATASNPYRKYLGVISNPNALDTLCAPHLHSIYLNGAQGAVNSLMNTIESYFYTGTTAYPCYGDTLTSVKPIDNIGLIKNINAYPNPFSERIFIEINCRSAVREGLLRYYLYDGIGKLCKSEVKEVYVQGNDMQVILFRNQLSSGIYFMNIRAPNDLNIATIKLTIF